MRSVAACTHPQRTAAVQPSACLMCRRTIGGTRYVKGYDAALEQLVTSVEATAGATQYAVWDTIINAATRVGDKTQTIRLAAGVVEQLPALPSSANLFDRIQIRIDRAARTLPALADLRDMRVHVPYHPFRQPGLLPHTPIPRVTALGNEIRRRCNWRPH